MALGPKESTRSTGWSGESSRKSRKSPAPAVERTADGTRDTSTGVRDPELLESLRVHQIELEMQNEELRHAQADLEASRARYFDLYDLAPVGYATIDDEGIILGMNLRATTLFGGTRVACGGRNFKFSIVAEDQDIYYLSHKRLLETGLPQVCELRMYRSGAPFWAQLEMVLGQTDGSRIFRIIIVDITDRKMAELQLQESQRQLQRSLAEQKTLAREVHHRVKNNFQVISSLLRMQAESLKDNSASAALKESHRRILSMALIHERLYGDDCVGDIDFGEYTRSLVNELFNCYAGSSGLVTKRLHTPRVLLNADQAIPCGLILNELVTNSLKYAYPDGQRGEVNVDLKETASGSVTLTVSDEGVGLPEGLDWNNSQSLGLPIVDILTKQLGGTLTVGSGPGALFTIEFQKETKALAASA